MATLNKHEDIKRESINKTFLFNLRSYKARTDYSIFNIRIFPCFKVNL